MRSDFYLFLFLLMQTIAPRHSTIPLPDDQLEQFLAPNSLQNPISV